MSSFTHSGKRHTRSGLKRHLVGIVALGFWLGLPSVSVRAEEADVTILRFQKSTVSVLDEQGRPVGNKTHRDCDIKIPVEAFENRIRLICLKEPGLCGSSSACFFDRDLELEFAEDSYGRQDCQNAWSGDNSRYRPEGRGAGGECP